MRRKKLAITLALAGALAVVPAVAAAGTTASAAGSGDTGAETGVGVVAPGVSAATGFAPVSCRRRARRVSTGSCGGSFEVIRLRYRASYTHPVNHGSPVCRAERKRPRFDRRT